MASKIVIRPIGILEVLAFEERGKPEYPAKNLTGQRREATESNPRSRWWEARALPTSSSLFPSSAQIDTLLQTETSKKTYPSPPLGLELPNTSIQNSASDVYSPG